MPYYQKKKPFIRSADNSETSNKSLTGTQSRYSRSGNSRMRTKVQSQRRTAPHGPQTQTSGSIASMIRQLESLRSPYWASAKSSQASTGDSNPIPQESQSLSSTHPKMVFQSALTSPMPKTQPTPSQEPQLQTVVQPHMPQYASLTIPAPRKLQ